MLLLLQRLLRVESIVFLEQRNLRIQTKKVAQRVLKIVSQHKFTNIMTYRSVFGNQMLTKWENLLLNLQEFIKK